MIVDAVDLERRAAQIAPQHGEHAQGVGLFEGDRDLLELAVRLVGAPVDRCADTDTADLEGLVDRGELDLVERVRGGQQFVVVELEDERDLVGIRSSDRAEHAQRRGHRVAAAFDGEFTDVGRIEVDRVGGEAGPGRVLDALVDGQDREVPGAGQATVVVHRLQVAQHRRSTIGLGRHPVDEIGPRQVQMLLRDRLARMAEQVLGSVGQNLLDLREHEAPPMRRVSQPPGAEQRLSAGPPVVHY